MNERLANQGRLQDLKLKAKSLELSISGLIHTLRAEMNPFSDVAEMNAELIQEQAIELAGKLIKYKEHIAIITAINKSLGREE